MVLSRNFFKQILPNAVFINDERFFAQNEIVGFYVDSRSPKKGEIFVALEGENFDGHDFLQQALQNGACGLLIKKEKEKKLKDVSRELLDKKLVFLVDDPLQALIQLAKNWRQKFEYPVIGITGSLGKTTTKEMVANILDGAKFSAFISFKNQNTIIGLSLNILNMRLHHKTAVFEIGINKAGEMEEIVDVLRPDIALITGIAHSHTQGLGNLESIAEHKKKIFQHFKESNIGIVNGDQKNLANIYYNHPVIKFGLKIKNQIQARKIKVKKNDDDKLETEFTLKIYSTKKRIALSGNHISIINNALAACSIAHLLGISFNNIVQGLQSFKGFENRFEKRKLKEGKGVIISDCYNANPESMKAAIFAFSQMECKGPKVAVLGDMLELDEKEKFWHCQIGRTLNKIDDLNFLILVGKRAKTIAKTAPLNIGIMYADDWKSAKNILQDFLKKVNKSDSLILTKASRGIGLYKMVKELSI